MNEHETYQMPQPLSFGGRILRRLFPFRVSDDRLLFIEKSIHGLTTETHIFFGWLDRLRLLCSGILLVEVRTNSDHDPGKSESLASVNVLPPRAVPRGKKP